MRKEIFVSQPTFLRRAFNFRNFLIIITLGFTILTFLAKQHDYFRTDLYFTLFIQSFNPFWFDALMRFVTILGNVSTVMILVALLALYGYMIGKRHAPVVLIISTVGGLFLSQILKTIVARPRPDPQLINQIGHFVQFDSFPSGHVLGAVSLYGFLLYIAFTQLKRNLISKMIMGVSLMAILLMGLSRIYLGAHWFSDVVGAYMVGFIWLNFVIFIYQSLKPKVRLE